MQRNINWPPKFSLCADSNIPFVTYVYWKTNACSLDAGKTKFFKGGQREEAVLPASHHLASCPAGIKAAGVSLAGS